jgi:ABC-2 type transport system ATP-binding protein
MANSIIEVENLRKEYDSGTVAVDGISFQVAKGEFFGFLGPNGAGKSTTMNMLVNLVKKTSGSIRIAGFDVNEHPNEVYKRVGFAMQEVGLDETATAEEMLQLHGRLYHLSPTEIAERSKELLKLVELEKVANRFTSTYSGGMRRRFDLALSLIHNPEVLFLDEPTTGTRPARAPTDLEPFAQAEPRRHDDFPDHALHGRGRELCERIAIMDAGKIVTEGSIPDFWKSTTPRTWKKFS